MIWTILTVAFWALVLATMVFIPVVIVDIRRRIRAQESKPIAPDLEMVGCSGADGGSGRRSGGKIGSGRR